MLKNSDKILLGLAVVVIVLPVFFSNIIIQPTKSLPPGLYLKSKLKGKLQVGDIVYVNFKNIPQRPNTYPILKNMPKINFVKVIAGTFGSVINVSNDGIFINGTYWGPVFKKDSKKRPLSRTIDGEYKLTKGWFLTLTPHPKSYDSRYYGPVHISQLQMATPLILLPL